MVLSFWLLLVDFEPLVFRRLGFTAWGGRILHAYGDFHGYFILQGGGVLACYSIFTVWEV